MILKSLIKRMLSGAHASPAAPQFSIESGLAEAAALQAAGHWDGAEELLRHVVTLAPDDAVARLQLGVLLGRQDKLDEAMSHLSVAVARNRQLPDVHNALGNIYLLKGDRDSAQRCYDEALKLNPQSAATYLNLGLLAQCGFDHAMALANFEKARQLDAALPGLLKNLVLEKIELGQAAEANAFLQSVRANRGQEAELEFCFGYVLLNLQQPHAAVEHFERANALAPHDPEILLQSGIALRETGEVEQAIARFDMALAADPRQVLAKWHKSLACLTLHEYSRGWQDYDLRLQSRDRMQRTGAYPEWGGPHAPKARLLVYGEQGPGDEIMFAGCLPQLIATAGECVLECSPKLVKLFSRSFPLVAVREAAQSNAGEQFDAQIALGSLPKYWRTSIADFPDHHGYLRADAVKTEAWRERLEGLGRGLKVGISWRGGTEKTRGYMRSIPLRQWGEILQVPGAHFVDLQYTDCGEEVAAAAAAFGVTVHRWDGLREDIDETAALVAGLDIVISVCTTLIHLGGALGKPVWVLTPYSPEWRYGVRGETMPWYPTVRLFRQQRFGVWEPVIHDVAKSLRDQCGAVGQVAASG